MTARIAGRLLAPRVGDLEGNRAAFVGAIRGALDRGADVVVLPELVTSGYVFASREEAASVAISAGAALFSEWAAEVARVAGGRGIAIGGFCERGEEGRLHNSAAVVDPSGVRAVYGEVHLWDREKLFFESGDWPPPVRADRGADQLAAGGWPTNEHPPEIVIAMATARTNRMFIACCDRTGTERGQQWTAGTSIIDEAG